MQVVNEWERTQIDYKTAIEFLLPRHYSGRKPSISYAYGLYEDDRLMAVCTFGKPASNTLCDGVCGKEFSKNVYELNRLCREEDCDYPLSQFVSWCLKQLSEKDLIIVSYSDMAMNHHGYIYQACNFIYTGATKQRTDMWTPSGKHSRHYKAEQQGKYRKVRSSKHRYVYFATNNKRTKRLYKQALKYPIKPYPKGDNSNYKLGEYLKETLIDAEGRKNELQENDARRTVPCSE